jgi:hypothetical protein
MFRMVVQMIVLAMIMGVVMMRVIVPRMIMARVPVASIGIGAAFGIERRLDLDHARAEPFHHRLDHVIAPDTQTLGHDLGRQMAVAEMPGHSDKMQRIDAADFDQRLRRGDHFDQLAILEHQRIAAAQRHRVFQVEQELKPARARHRHPPPVPVVEIEHDGVGGRFFPAMLALDFRGADHRFKASGLWRR